MINYHNMSEIKPPENYFFLHNVKRNTIIDSRVTHILIYFTSKTGIVEAVTSSDKIYSTNGLQKQCGPGTPCNKPIATNFPKR